MEPDRLNSPSTCTITLEVMGHELHFAQDPNSKHLGTTVWDASMVFVKFLEKNCRKGRFSRSKLKGKRAIELGAGCGVAGFGMAMLGCDVISTDQREVLPLLKRNSERNASSILQMNPAGSGSFGSLQVAELDWGNEEHIMAVKPPFDYVIGTDVVYSEQLLEPLLHTILTLSGPKTMVMLGYELRSTSVHEKMLQMWKENFEIKTIPRSKMDVKYQDPSIQLFIMGQKSSTGSSETPSSSINHEVDAIETKQEKVENSGGQESSNGAEATIVRLKEDSLLMRLREGKLSDWETRRYGTIAAQLLRDVKIDVQLKK